MTGQFLKTEVDLMELEKLTHYLAHRVPIPQVSEEDLFLADPIILGASRPLEERNSPKSLGTTREV